MQTKDQVNERFGANRWKIVASAATLSALGITAVSLADTAPRSTPEAINLSDRAQLSGVATTLPPFVISPGQILAGDLDSPFDTNDNTNDSPLAGAATVDSPDSPDSPDTAVADSPDSPDSVDGSADS